MADDERAVETALQDPAMKSSNFRSRYLTSDADKMAHNAWDDVEWDADMLAAAKAKVAADEVTLAPEEISALDAEADSHWDAFYRANGSKFFKERHYLHLEFPFLVENEGDGKTLLEVGCGTGASVFPLARAGPRLSVKCFDFAESAVALVRENPDYETHGGIDAFVWNIAKDPIPTDHLQDNSVDYVLLIFVLSAIAPADLAGVIDKLYRVVKPGGLVILRDYGRYDLAQLRFKQGRKLDDNFYVRGDSTQVYFFTLEEMAAVFESAGFAVVKNAYDRRLIVNRKTKQTMYRVWLQSQFQKPIDS